MEVGYQVGQVVIRDTIDPQQQWRNHLEQFRASRDAGFDIYCWAHHYLIDPFQHFQPFPVLARLAAEPGDMKLATSVLLLPLLNPVDVAEQVATLDHICEGRFILGLGLGYRPEECEAFDTRMSERGARHSEALALMQRLWTEDEVTHHGRYYHVTGARPTARPYQKPYPKLWLAAMSDPAVRRVGREGHILFIGPAQPFGHHRAGRWSCTMRRWPKTAMPTREKWWSSGSFSAPTTGTMCWTKPGADSSASTPNTLRTDCKGPIRKLVSKVTGDLEGLMDDTFIVGSPDDCVEQIARYRDLGFTQVILRLFYPEMQQKDVMEHIELVGRDLLPNVHKL